MPQLLGFVVVGADGTTLHASGVSKVDHISTGVYHVTFTASVADSCEIASLGNYETAGYVTAYGIPPVGPNVVEVTTFNANATVQDLTFQLLVVAPDGALIGTVPDLGGQTVNMARSTAEKAGFVMQITSYESVPGKGPAVVDNNTQQPPAETQAPLGSNINVMIDVPGNQ